MNQNICYNCGGDFVFRDSKLVCAYCGTIKPDGVSSEELTLLYTAYQRLRLSDFSDAEQEFDDIIRRHPRNAQAHWGRLLARYGIKYEEDYDGSKVPTCYAASIESVFEASDYKKALEYADEEIRSVYKDHAEYIERCRCDWVKEASLEKPYDIFISYKDSDRERGLMRTSDSFSMQDLYIYLTNHGYRVFFSHESLRGISGKKYEPYIFNALSTTKVMIVYGSKPEYINATWVKNEWTRYLKRIRDGEKALGSLLVAYEGFSPMELPGTLSSLQCLNAGDKRFYTDLLESIKRILEEDKKTSPVQIFETKKASCNHKPVKIPDNPPTCNEEGSTEGAFCPLCGEMLKKVEVIPATGHRFGEWHIVKAATCTENGLHERACIHCGVKETQEIPSRGGHIAGQWTTEKNPSPDMEGLRVKKCVVCGKKLAEETLPALPVTQENPSAQAKSAKHPKNISQGLAYKINKDGKTCSVIGQGACKDKDIVIPKNIDGYRVTHIATAQDHGRLTSGFDQTITSVVIPDSVTSIGDWAFEDCANLTNVIIPDSVTTIGHSAFSFCTSLKNITLPNSVVSIENYAFSGVGEVSVSENHPNYLTVDGNLYTKDGKILIHYAANKTDTFFTVPNSVTSIGDNAFFGCKSLTSVVIPDSVTSIGVCAFNCCISLESAVIPNSVTSIGDSAFWVCTSLTNMIIPNSVTNLGNSMFGGCKNLKSAVIPQSVKSIGKHAFWACTSLTSLQYAGTRKQWNQIQLNEDWKTDSAIRSVECKKGFHRTIEFD